MGYQALLFCPDEKTARSLTQVLSELEFNVEPCHEPFAAVKKLMGVHFDAVVVDCDNEQNAALLFKSARNSTSNQSSLAVAVVEGQAGVAKAFRIGANLVLTKPINIEQAKGTLRVARGLLRKGDPAKPAAPATTATASAAPAKTPAAVPTARPAASSVAKPVPSAARPAQAASTISVPAAPPAAKKVAEPVLATTKPPVAAAPASPAPAAEATHKPAAPAPSASLRSGAASAPAPAREILEIPPLELKPVTAPSEDDEILETLGAEHPSASAAPVKDVPPPSFTFGGANAAAESGGARKIVMGIVATVLVAGALYGGWTYYQDHMAHSASTPLPKLSTPPTPGPSSAQPAPVASPAAVPEAEPATQPAATVPAPSAAVKDNANDNEAAPEEDASPAAPSSARPKSSGSSPTGKPAPATPAPAPLVVKGGAAPATKPAPAEPDAAAPSVIGIAVPGSSGPPPDLGTNNAAKPVLQKLNISQGVSTGLLIKRIDPVYPTAALHMRIEGQVQLLATISKTGDITLVKVLSGDHQLTQAAVDAVKRWKYKPYLLNGEPVEIDTQVTINFKLPH